MPTSIQTSKFGTLDTSGRVPIYAGDNVTDLKQIMAFELDIGGVRYRFMPEDRISKGTVYGDTGLVATGFLNPTLVNNFKDASEYVDLKDTTLGKSYSLGDFVKNNLGASTKGYLAPPSAYAAIESQGYTPYKVSTTGPVQGIAQVEGKPVFYGFDGTINETGNINYRQAVGQVITGYTYSDGGGLLAGLGRELNKISPAIGYVSMAYLTAVTGGALGSALMSSGAMTSAAAASAAATAAGATAAGAAAAGAAATAAATAVGTAVASVTAQVAMGVPVDTAVKNAAVNAVAQTQLPGITAQIQQAVDSPAVASALANASTSYAATVAKGGTADAAAKNALAGAAGSITQNLTGSKSAADAMKVVASGGSADKAAEAAALAFFNEQVASESAKKRQEAADAEAKIKADDEAERLRQAGLQEQTEADRLAKERADAEASARQSAIDEQNRLDAEAQQKAADEQNRLAVEAKQKADDEAERLRQAGLEEKTDVDLNKIVTPEPTKPVETTTPPADTTTPPADSTGQEPTVNDGTAVGDITKPLDGADAYKYDPVKKTYTYTDDDGSTITLDEGANPIGFTEATDTAWSRLTDTKTGNLKLPALPGGKTPAVKPPAKTPAATPTTTPPGGGAVTIPKAGTSTPAGGGLNIAALMAIMGGFGDSQQQQPQQIEPYEPGKGFEYFDWGSDPFGPQTKDKTNPAAQPKMAGGGSVDEILEILRRSGI
jgi:hypothetical protein